MGAIYDQFLLKIKHDPGKKVFKLSLRKKRSLCFVILEANVVPMDKKTFGSGRTDIPFIDQFRSISHLGQYSAKELFFDRELLSVAILFL